MEKRKEKLLVSDYDETLYLNEEDMKKNSTAIKNFRKNNNIFIIATGRSYQSIIKEIAKYDIEYDYLILNHGALTIDKNKKILQLNIINNEIKDLLLKEITKKETTDIILSTSLYDTKKETVNNILRIQITYKNEEVRNKDYQKIIKKYNSYLKLYKIAKDTIEITSNNTDKAYAIKKLIVKNKILKENVYTIGDNYNDNLMLKEFNGSSMENAVKDITKITTHKYPSVSTLINSILQTNN